MEFHSPQLSQRPDHLGKVAAHLVQVNWVTGFAMAR
jgi:hypothetical protein